MAIIQKRIRLLLTSLHSSHFYFQQNLPRTRPMSMRSGFRAAGIRLHNKNLPIEILLNYKNGADCQRDLVFIWFRAAIRLCRKFPNDSLSDWGICDIYLVHVWYCYNSSFPISFHDPHLMFISLPRVVLYLSSLLGSIQLSSPMGCLTQFLSFLVSQSQSPSLSLSESASSYAPTSL